MGYFCPKINLSKKYIPSAKTLYTEDLTFNYLCGNSLNYLCHYIIFLETTPLYFLAQTLHTFYKSSSSKSKFSDFSLLGLKFTKFLVIFQTKNQFFFKVWISFLCHERSFFCTFLAETLYPIDKNSISKCKFSECYCSH